MSQFQPRRFIVNFNNGTAEFHDCDTPPAEEYLSIGEHEFLIDHARQQLEPESAVAIKLAIVLREYNNLTAKLCAAEAKLRVAIIAANEVQNKLGEFQSNSSSSFAPLRQAWNINAKFLSDNFQLQTEWLEKLAQADGGKGEEKNV